MIPKILWRKTIANDPEIENCAILDDDPERDVIDTLCNPIVFCASFEVSSETVVCQRVPSITGPVVSLSLNAENELQRLAVYVRHALPYSPASVSLIPAIPYIY
jgi:hypothetical protein